MRFKLISCQVFCREIAAVMKESPHEIEVEFLSKGLHEIPCTEMCRRLQQAVDRAATGGFDAVLLAYGFCNHGLAGLRANRIPLVLPRAHDCIEVLLGRERAQQQRETHPGTYFQSSGWIEHRRNPEELASLSTARRQGLYSSHEELTERFGPGNADYLKDLLGDHTRHYSNMVYIQGDTPVDGRYAGQTEAEAARRGWSFTALPADLSLLRRLVIGDWDETDFLVVPSDGRVAACYDARIIQSEPSLP